MYNENKVRICAIQFFGNISLLRRVIENQKVSKRWIICKNILENIYENIMLIMPIIELHCHRPVLRARYSETMTELVFLYEKFPHYPYLKCMRTVHL